MSSNLTYTKFLHFTHNLYIELNRLSGWSVSSRRVLGTSLRSRKGATKIIKVLITCSNNRSASQTKIWPVSYLHSTDLLV